MPELSPLPRLRPTPVFAPDEERLARTVSAAQRRRALRTSVPVGAALAVVAVAVLAGSGAGGTAGLDVADAPTPTVAVPTPWVSTSVGPDGVGVSGGVGDSPAPRGPSGSPPTSPDESATPSTAPPASSSPGPEWDGFDVSTATLTRVPYDAANCEASAREASAGWCTRIPVTQAVSGQVTDLVFDVCRPATDGSMQFGGDEEVIFDAKKDDLLVGGGIWSSRPGGGAHDLAVAAGTCARWTAPWRAVRYDDEATAIPPGTYDATWNYYDWLDVPVHPGCCGGREFTLTIVAPQD